MNNAGLGLYIHLPFCRSKCVYCDFVSFARRSDSEVEEYVEYLLKEIELYREVLSTGVSTLYIGGGTPSLLPLKFLDRIFKALERYLGNVSEMTIEVNPDSFSSEMASHYRELGINRLSMGLQSADDTVLKKSGRLYDFETFLRKYDLAKRFFDNVNVDFIIGLPGESWYTIEANIVFISDFKPDHVSVYMLETHEEAPHHQVLKKPDDQTFMRYEELIKFLKSAGYERYEISNFALEGKYCKHNLKYWFNEDYVGIGVSAGGHIGWLRYNNYEELNDYFIALSEGRFPRSYESENTPHREALETLFMALRTKWGISPEKVLERTGVDVSEVYKRLQAKFDFFDGEKLSETGMDFSNLFFVNLLETWESVLGYA